MSQFTEFELDLRRAVEIAIADKTSPTAVEIIMRAVIEIEKRLAAIEPGS